MKLWCLERADSLPMSDDPWAEGDNIFEGFVVRAPDEAEARRIAQDFARQSGGVETRGKQWTDMVGCLRGATTTTPWLDPHYSICVELTADGEPGIVLSDFYVR